MSHTKGRSTTLRKVGQDEKTNASLLVDGDVASRICWYRRTVGGSHASPKEWHERHVDGLGQRRVLRKDLRPQARSQIRSHVCEAMSRERRGQNGICSR